MNFGFRLTVSITRKSFETKFTILVGIVEIKTENLNHFSKIVVNDGLSTFRPYFQNVRFGFKFFSSNTDG